MRKVCLILTMAATAVVGTSTATQASPVTFTGSSGNLAASVTFSITAGGDLQVLLQNTSSADVLAPADVLTAVFFDMGGGVLTPLSALLNGSTVYYDADGQPAGGNVGGEWAYGSGLSGAPGNADRGISSSGLGGVFGDPNFNGPNLENPDALDGLQYGILSAGDNTATGNGGITGSGGLIKSSVTFTLNGVGDLDESLLTTIRNVSFQYGTALNEPNIRTNCLECEQLVATPEPASMLLLGTGLAAVASRLRKRKSK